jgi:hypothetical protein
VLAWELLPRAAVAPRATAVVDRLESRHRDSGSPSNTSRVPMDEPAVIRLPPLIASQLVRIAQHSAGHDAKGRPVQTAAYSYTFDDEGVPNHRRILLETRLHCVPCQHPHVDSTRSICRTQGAKVSIALS